MLAYTGVTDEKGVVRFLTTPFAVAGHALMMEEVLQEQHHFLLLRSRAEP